jgi:hypothetical protein
MLERKSALYFLSLLSTGDYSQMQYVMNWLFLVFCGPNDKWKVDTKEGQHLKPSGDLHQLESEGKNFILTMHHGQIICPQRMEGYYLLISIFLYCERDREKGWNNTCNRDNLSNIFSWEAKATVLSIANSP